MVAAHPADPRCNRRVGGGLSRLGLPLVRVGEIKWRRRNRKVDERIAPGILEAMHLAVGEAHDLTVLEGPPPIFAKQ